MLIAVIFFKFKYFNWPPDRRPTDPYAKRKSQEKLVSQLEYDVM